MRIHPIARGPAPSLTLALALLIVAGCAPKPPTRIVDLRELESSSGEPESKTVLVRGTVGGLLPITGDEADRYMLFDEQPCGQLFNIARINLPEGQERRPDIAAYRKALAQVRPDGPELHVVFEADPVYFQDSKGRWRPSGLMVRRVVSQALAPFPACKPAPRRAAPAGAPTARAG
jgi:hypothetical protein